MKIIWITSIALFGLIACSEKSAGNTTETTNAISGVIKDKDGNILSNNPVLLRQIDTLNNISEEIDLDTDQNGEFSEKLEPGLWSIEVFNQDSTQGLINSIKIDEDKDFGVMSLSETMLFTGIINDSDKKYSIVKLQQNQRSTVLSSDGSFAFNQLPRGIYEVSFLRSDSSLMIDTLDLTYAPDSLKVQWENEKKVNLLLDDNEIDTTTLRAYWNFDDALLTDIGPDSINAHLAGNIELVDGQLNSAIQLVSHTHIHFGAKKTLLEISENQDFGFSMWINVKDDGAQNLYGIMNIQPSEDYVNGFDLFLNTSTKKLTLIEVNFGGISDTLLQIPFDFISKKWHHIAIYRQGNLYGIEVDREFVQQRFAMKASSFEKGWLLLGANHLFQNFYKNKFDELYFFDGAPNKNLLDSLYDHAKN